MPETEPVQNLDNAPCQVISTERRQSPTLKEFAVAMAEVQKILKNPKKESKNDFFKKADGKASKYADLAACADACREPLASNGFSVLAFPSSQGKRVSVETLLLHKSGEYMSGTISAEVRDSGPQAVTAGVTYLRRAGLTSLVFLTPEDEDDDGNTAEGRKGPSQLEKMISAFRDLTPPVTVAELEKFIRHDLSKISETEQDEFTDLYKKLQKGNVTIADFLPKPKTVQAPPVDHTPAQPVEAPRPGEQPAEAAKETVEPTTEDEPATDEWKRKNVHPAIRIYQEIVGGPAAMKAFIEKYAGKDSKKLSQKRWEEVLKVLAAAKEKSDESLRSLVVGK